MKKLILFAASAMMMLGFSACNHEEYFNIDYYDILPGDIMFKNATNIEAGLTGVYDTFYGNWKWSPTYMVQNITTMDILAGGWDAAFSTHDWTAGTSQFRTLWNNYYKGVTAANFFLEGAEETDASVFNGGEAGKKKAIAQARAIRAMNYLELVQGWGRVPMVMTGENGSNTPEKPRPENDDECWKLIEEDLTYAIENLDFDPVNGQYGRITKGTALGYRAEAYACQGKWDKAKADYEAIISSGKYKLLPCFSYLFDSNRGWSSEDLWCIPMYNDFGKNMHTFGGGGEDTYSMSLNQSASIQFGGWGSTYVSWETYESYEPGDKRRVGSMVGWGDTNPFTGDKLGFNADGTPDEEYDHAKVSGEFLPNVFSIKYWRMHAIGDDTVNCAPYTAHHMRYANILLNYAEACFRTEGEDSAKGWDAIKQVRNRAFGNLEVTLNDPTYPIPMNTEVVEVPDAKTVYTAYKALKGYSAPVWQVAVNQERRKEFNLEFCLFFDLKRSGFIEQHINCEYPKYGTAMAKSVPNTDPAAPDSKPWYRNFDFNPNKMIFPIPTTEMDTNKALKPEDQNPGY